MGASASFCSACGLAPRTSAPENPLDGRLICVATILNSSAFDGYAVSEITESQIPMIAPLIDEPTYPDVVELLQVVSPDESRLYSCQDNVVALEVK